MRDVDLYDVLPDSRSLLTNYAHGLVLSIDTETTAQGCFNQMAVQGQNESAKQIGAEGWSQNPIKNKGDFMKTLFTRFKAEGRNRNPKRNGAMGRGRSPKRK